MISLVKQSLHYKIYTFTAHS